METYTLQEEERIDAQREKLGAVGLTTKTEILAKALEQNEKQAPPDLIRSFPIPDISSISYHAIKRYCNRGTEAETGHCDRFAIEKIPIRFQLDDVKTQFVYLYALMDTSLIPVEQRLYLPLLMACLLESAVLRDGKLIPYEQVFLPLFLAIDDPNHLNDLSILRTVVSQLTGDTVKTHSAIGIDAASGKHFACGSFCNVAVLMLQLERDKYAEGIVWMRDLLRRTVFTAERVRVIAAKVDIMCQF